jgi:CRISPR/Cas system CMR subunit Cmr4 (Cas7 group RAMP superfamily)
MTKNYLFNPFKIRNAEDKDLQNLYNEVFEELIEDPNTMYEYAHNIEVYSNLNYIVGECIARLTKSLIELKTQIEINKAIKTVEERNNWNEEELGKKPAISYFEALATRFCEKDIQTLAKKESELKRFKNAYSSVEEKLNALKKRMESIKYEEIGE